MTAEERLTRWNSSDSDLAAEELLPCNGSRAWARDMAARRPFLRFEDIFAAADAIWSSLPLSEWYEAFSSHPRIGERYARTASSTSLQWSAGEQGGISDEEAAQAALVAGNRRYEQRFGRVFLVCATGKSAAEILSILQARLQNDPGTELLEAAEQQRRITQLRLRKWLGLPSATCEDV